MKKTIYVLFLLLSMQIMQAQVPQSERDALIAIYNALGGDNWYYNNNWNSSNSVFDWYGITVENINGQDHVTKIELSYNNLSGSLVPEIGNFPELKTFDVTNNFELGGNLPVEIGNLSNLENLLLYNCSFIGGIPTEIGTLVNLHSLYFSNNHFTGNIPSNFINLTQLVNLSFYNNELSGTIPDFTGFSNLNYLGIAWNNFQFADFEADFNDLLNLIQSNGGNFNYNHMNPIDYSYDLDVVYGNTYSMIMSPVSGTGVTYQWYLNDDPIPGATSMIYDIVNVQEADLGNYTCKASSSIVTDLTIDRNYIHVYGPVNQTDKDALIALYNATDGNNWVNNSNWLTAEPVHEWHGITVFKNRVTGIDLINNNMTGVIPPELGDCVEVKDLVFWNNNLTGTIPVELGNLVNLETISLEDNQLTGNIPDSFANCTKMKSFWLNGNQLSGDVPDIFSSMPDLYYVSLGLGYPDIHQAITGDIDLTQNSNLHGIWLTNLEISSIDVRNNHNDLIDPYYYFNVQNNPNLICIFVDDATWSENTWTNVDPTAHFVETEAECATYGVKEFDTSLIEIYPNPTQGKIYLDNHGVMIKKIELYNMSGQKLLTMQATKMIDVSDLDKGFYLLRLIDDNNNEATYKVVKN